MKVNNLQGCLQDLYHAGRNSVLLIGPPGIGKTAVTKEVAIAIAKYLGKEFFDYKLRRGNTSEEDFIKAIMENPGKYFLFLGLNLNDCEPTDLSGFPRESLKVPAVVNKPLGWALCFACSPGILFLDELTNVQRLDVLTASYKLILERSAGFTQFNKDVMIIAAGNSPEESVVANLLPAPLANRFSPILNVEVPEIYAWAQWMDGKYPEAWDKRVLAYLAYFKDSFLKLPRETETLVNFPTPRSWTTIALLLASNKIRSHLDETIVGTLGPDVGSTFAGFLHTDIPEAEELLRKPEKFGALDINQKCLASMVIGMDLKNRFVSAKSEKDREKEIEKTTPLLRAMSDVQRDFPVIAIFSCGEERFDIVLETSRKDRALGDMFARIAELRMAMEV